MFSSAICQRKSIIQFLCGANMATYFVSEKDERFPFSENPDLPKAVAIEIGIAIEYCEYQLAAYEADSNEALTARLSD